MLKKYVADMKFLCINIFKFLYNMYRYYFLSILNIFYYNKLSYINI